MTSPVSYPYRSSSQNKEAQRLSLLLDAANRKIDDYIVQIASLSADLKQYRENICVSCKEKVLFATYGTSSLQLSVITSPSPTSSEHAGITAPPSDPESPVRTSIQVVETGTEPPSPVGLSACREGSSNSSLDSDASFHTASQSISDSSNATPDRPLSTSSLVPSFPVDYNPEIGKPLDLSVAKVFAFPATVQCVKFSREGKYFAVALYNGETHIYDMTTMANSILVEHGTLVFYSEAAAASKQRPDLRTVRFSPDSKYIATGGRDGQIKIWQIKRKRLCALFTGHTSVVRCIDFSPDGLFLASASYDHTVRIWRVRDGISKLLESTPMYRDFNSVAFSPDGRYVAAGNDDRLLRIWDVRTGRLLKKWMGHTDVVRAVAFQPDGKGMASGSDDQTWKSWDLGSFLGSRPCSSAHLVNDEVEKEVFTFEGHANFVTTISFSSDGRWVVTSSGDSTSRIWDASTGTWMCTLKGHTGYVWAADFSPTGQYLVTGANESVMLWEYREEAGNPDATNPIDSTLSVGDNKS